MQHSQVGDDNDDTDGDRSDAMSTSEDEAIENKIQYEKQSPDIPDKEGELLAQMHVMLVQKCLRMVNYKQDIDKFELKTEVSCKGLYLNRSTGTVFTMMRMPIIEVGTKDRRTAGRFYLHWTCCPLLCQPCHQSLCWTTYLLATNRVRPPDKHLESSGIRGTSNVRMQVTQLYNQRSIIPHSSYFLFCVCESWRGYDDCPCNDHNWVWLSKLEIGSYIMYLIIIV